jgi:hypothetical protein
MARREYLGDSVYVEVCDEGMLKLTTHNGYPDDPRNVIYLDDSVLHALLGYVERLRNSVAHPGEDVEVEMDGAPPKEG